MGPRWFRVFINREERPAIFADSWQAARAIARRTYRRRCDII